MRERRLRNTPRRILTMSRPSFALLAAVVTTLVAGACYQDDSTAANFANRRATRVLITDAPFPFDTVQSVDVYIVSISASTEPDTGSSADSMQWVPIVEPHRQINLLSLQRGTTSLLGEKEIPADQYKAVRVIIDADSSAIRFKDGSQAVVRWRGGRQAIHSFVEAAVNVPSEGADIVLDFDVGKSFPYNNLGDGAFDFFPWIRAVNEAATGSISGIVSQDTSAGTPGPLANATVSAWGGGPGNWYVYSTGSTDAAGHYKLAYLLSGNYIVGVDPPSPSSLASSLDSSVFVNQGADTPHSIVLSMFRGSVYIYGASSMLVGSTNRLEAFVINAQHQQDTTAVVAWKNLDTTVLGLVVDSARVARVTAKQVGSGRIVASSGGLADTLRILVVPDSTPPPAPRRP
ncbi:MAG: hypothetical protein DMD54_08950 [Gemmatimonadetes bacterium]|nr:MAG: hypothetical protein DMD54_08950 [Gemmatimonadota bacterium]